MTNTFTQLPRQSHAVPGAWWRRTRPPAPGGQIRSCVTSGSRFAHSTQIVFYIMTNVMAAICSVAVRGLRPGRTGPSEEPSEVPITAEPEGVQ
jgi:hypothetical protein